MILYASELEAFESFCRNEFDLLFKDAPKSLSSSLTTVRALQTIFASAVEVTPSLGELDQFRSIKYSFFSGGKRFRPLVAFAVADYLDVPIFRVFPWAMAIEMIHTYSLIHDDLPSMDNDDLRRGQPTNHKVFGDAIALLSGDALLTEAFGILSKHYKNENLSLLISGLVNASGIKGMILGQYLDMTLEKGSVPSSIFELNTIHLLKTGALIGGSFQGAAILKDLQLKHLNSIQEIGFLTGYAFQVKDDILDSEQDKGSKKNINFYIPDKKELVSLLTDIHKKIEVKIVELNLELGINEIKSSCLTQFLSWNMKREK